jgi:hypothetical protein
MIDAAGQEPCHRNASGDTVVLLRAKAAKVQRMIVHLARRDGGAIVLERIEEPVMFEGGQAQEGVLVTFPLDGEAVKARIIKVLPHDPEAEPAIEVELIDEERLDAASLTTLANLPPKDDFTTEL